MKVSMTFDPSDIIFVVALAAFVWLVLQIVDGEGGGGKRTPIPV
jgi:hypothetical protein